MKHPIGYKVEVLHNIKQDYCRIVCIEPFKIYNGGQLAATIPYGYTEIIKKSSLGIFQYDKKV
ncbi:hypothetical protein FDH01_gp179 [Acinetobacter phage vB_AbaM_ME3]|uniref:Uncharacterized protein n=1 Tax=Acinetobacter phage vB_AbaM_ME3 TaxID=1837876 RepID=A0A172Q0X7_9CAUD|nr:hypothetical protein FDH01_gp179 [Acinetobacter phage vB_AbaM_ME3]AND75443.1 hypothetical protein ME3_282 [Acinetobacter phage vB_AbaM_ME3]